MKSAHRPTAQPNGCLHDRSVLLTPIGRRVAVEEWEHAAADEVDARFVGEAMWGAEIDAIGAGGENGVDEAGDVLGRTAEGEAVEDVVGDRPARFGFTGGETAAHVVDDGGGHRERGIEGGDDVEVHRHLASALWLGPARRPRRRR